MLRQNIIFKRWVKILATIYLTSPVHNNEVIFTIEQEFYIERLRNNDDSIKTIEQATYTLHGELLRFIKNNMDKSFYDPNLLDEGLLSNSISDFLNMLISS